MSANRPATAGSWKKGQSGNPNGAPKRGMSWREIIEQVGDEDARTGVPNKVAVARAMYSEAVRGNTNAAGWLARYGGGTTELSTLSDSQLRDSLALRLGIALGSEQTGDDFDSRQEADAN